MIIIDVEKPEVKEKKPEMSLSQQKLLRDAKEEAQKKMTNEKIQLLKRAGIIK